MPDDCEYLFPGPVSPSPFIFSNGTRGLRVCAACGIRGMLSTRINGSLALSLRAKFQMFLFIPDFASACELVQIALHFVTSFFLQCVYPAYISTQCRFTVSSEIPSSQQRSSFNQMSDVFRGVITHHSCPQGQMPVRPIFTVCCHCHCHCEREGPSFSNLMNFFREDGVANPRSEVETYGSSFARPERVVSVRLPQTLDVRQLLLRCELQGNESHGRILRERGHGNALSGCSSLLEFVSTGVRDTQLKMARPPCNRGTMLRCIRNNCGTICKLDRLPELYRWARACRAPALLLQGLASGIEQYGDVEGYMIFVSARSGPTRKDGVLVALCMRTFARSEVTAVHEIVTGKALGIRVKGKRGKEELDVYLVSANAPVVQPGDADTVGAAHHTFVECRVAVFWSLALMRMGRWEAHCRGLGQVANVALGRFYVGRWTEKWKRTLHLGQRLWWETAEHLRTPPC